MIINFASTFTVFDATYHILNFLGFTIAEQAWFLKFGTKLTLQTQIKNEFEILFYSIIVIETC